MSAWDRFMGWLRSLFGVRPPVAPPDFDERPESLRPRVLLITFNPVIRSEGGQKLTELLRWRNVDQLCREYIADLIECSDGFVEFQIVERIEVDAWPAKVDGFRYDETSFLQCWRSQTGFHEPDAVDYEAIISSSIS